MKPKQIENFLEQARIIAKMSHCQRRKFGAVITTKDGVHLSDGYNGSARDTLNCGTDDVPCGKDLMNEPHYSSYEYCAAVHAEENAIINAARNGISVKGGILFLNSAKDEDCGSPCMRCRRAIINAGISEIYYKSQDDIEFETRPDLIHKENKWMKDRYKKDEESPKKYFYNVQIYVDPEIMELYESVKDEEE